MTRLRLLTFTLFLFCFVRIDAQNVPSPKEHFGFNIGDNYRLANYTEAEAYFKKLSASNRVKLVDIGKTEEGRTQYMIIVSSPENIRNLDKYKEISQQLARAEGMTDEQAHALAREGRAVVWIDGGLHANETVGAHQLIETIWQFVSKKDDETMKILDETIILFVHANPDGQELQSNWYLRNTDTLKRSLAQLPRLYQKYIGHDNNRDFYMNNMKESQNMSKQLYIEWMPQIMYNHHQAGPAGSVVAGPPYRDPFNFVYDPILMSSLDGVGAAMNNRLNVEGKPGYTSRTGSVFSTWWNGGLRTTAYFHNIIGLLTEIIGSPTPATVPLVPQRLIPNTATPFPVTPQRWLYKQSIDYSVSLNYAVLDHAARNREHLLFNIYKMGKNSIIAGGKDNWSLSPRKIEDVYAAYKKDQRPGKGDSTSAADARPSTIPSKHFNTVFKDTALRDPRGYIISANQADFPTAVKFVNALLYSGIKIHKAKADFSVEGKKYPAGSYVVKTNQAFRPHVLDMFEPQDHPNDFQYPGGPPIAPYDAAGWTPAYSMGFQFERVLNAFDGPFEVVKYGDLQKPTSTVPIAKAGAGYVLDSRINNAFILVNDLLQAGAEVYRINNTTGMNPAVAPGSFFIPAGGKTTGIINNAAANWGVNVSSLSKRPGDLVKVTPQRIALWDTYGGSMPSGWTRWILEQFHYPFTVVYANEINAGNLRDKYDVIVFVGGAIPSATGRSTPRDTSFKPETIPAEFKHMIGRITADTSIPQLKQFMDAGGSIITVGSSTNLAYHLKLPVRNALVEMQNGKEVNLPREKYYIPGSILRVQVDSTQKASSGIGSEADVYFDNSPVFSVAPDAIAKGEVIPLLWFASDKPLRSGWAWGQEYLRGGVTAFSAPVGKGKLYAFGPEITFRAQTHRTFKFLFNQLYAEVK